MIKSAQRLIQIGSKAFFFLLLCTSFQPIGKNVVTLKQVGLARDQPAEIRLHFNKNDRIHLTFRDKNNNVYLDKDIEYSLRKLPGKSVGSGSIAGSFKSIEIEEGGEYFLELKKSTKKDAFINIEIDKTVGSWTESSKPPITVQSALLHPPMKGGKPGGMSIVFPVKKGQKVIMNGSGKDASAISLYVPNFEQNTSLEKGVNLEIGQDMALEVIVYLDEDNLKSKGLVDKVTGLFKKGGGINLNQFSDLKAQVVKKTEQNNVGTNPFDSKPDGNVTEGNRLQESGKELSIQEIMKQAEEKNALEMARQKEIFEELNENISKLSSSEKTRLVPLDAFSKILDLPNKFDFSIDKKRVCTNIFGFKPDVEFYIAYWVGINGYVHQRYLSELGRMRSDPNIFSTPLAEYSNYLYYQKGYRELAANVPMRFPLSNPNGACIDDVEIALLDKNNQTLFLNGEDYTSIASGVVGSSGQMFGLAPAAIAGELFLCACNHNKLSPVKLFVYTESFGLPEIQ